MICMRDDVDETWYDVHEGWCSLEMMLMRHDMHEGRCWPVCLTWSELMWYRGAMGWLRLHIDWYATLQHTTTHTDYTLIRDVTPYISTSRHISMCNRSRDTSTHYNTHWCITICNCVTHQSTQWHTSVSHLVWDDVIHIGLFADI